MSSSAVAVDVRGLSKRYWIRHNAPRATNLMEAVSGTWQRLRGRNVEQFWALRDASFQLAQGEVIGIIGRNGAGKSTLLKILSRIVEPTYGEAFLRGRLGSLLEVGTGFHPEFTGRENIFLNGAMLGMPRSFVERQFDSIVDFSGMERFLDTPVKRYSSGMYVRLAFAVAAHLDCDVLIVDEVLAVGDDAFQRKCLGKMSEVVGQGRTVIFVSHNMSAISALAPRCLFVDQGHIVFDGPTDRAIEHYLGEENATAQRGYEADASPDRPTVTRVEVNTAQGGRVHAHGDPLDVLVDVTTPERVQGARLTVNIVNRLGRVCTQAWLHDANRPFCRQSGIQQLVCHFPHLRLAPGQYTLKVTLADGIHKAAPLDRICPFEVVMKTTREGGWPVNEVAYFDDVEWTIGER